MGKIKSNELAMELAFIRQDIITHCESLPQIIKTHGPNSLGSLALAIGKCFAWVGPRLDRFTVIQPLPGATPLIRVADIGEQMRVIGLEILHCPVTGELQNTIYTLRQQVDLLERLARIQTEGKR